MESEQSPAPDHSPQEEPREESQTLAVPDTSEGKPLSGDERDDSDIETLQILASELFLMLQKATSNQDPNTILEIDATYFCELALNKFMVEDSLKCVHLIKSLTHIYVHNDCNLKSEEIPKST